MQVKKLNQELVSVVINCHNGEDYLRLAIDSVYGQIYQNWEIVLWDNASTDESAQIANSYDSKLKYYYNEELISLGNARNRAISKCIGEYIAFLDCDDKWTPSKLESQVYAFKDNKVGLVYTLAENHNTKAAYNEKVTSIGIQDLINNYDISMSSAMLRKRHLLEVGGVFDILLNQAEEYDLFMRKRKTTKTL